MTYITLQKTKATIREITTVTRAIQKVTRIIRSSQFNSTIMNTVTNFIPNETITCDDRDPPWMNSFMKKLIHAKDNFYKKFFHKNNNMYHLCAFKNFFNSFFADQCSPSGSVLSSELPLRTESTLSSCHFKKDDILRIINNLDPNKAHDHAKISIHMLKICGDSICKSLNIIFKTCLRKGKFPLEWKKANIGDKQTKR